MVHGFTLLILSLIQMHIILHIILILSNILIYVQFYY